MEQYYQTLLSEFEEVGRYQSAQATQAKARAIETPAKPKAARSEPTT